MEAPRRRARQPLARLPGRRCRRRVDAGRGAVRERCEAGSRTNNAVIGVARGEAINQHAADAKLYATEQRGLRCPRCGCGHFRVVYTRPTRDGRIMRRRQCRPCGRRVTTIERLGGQSRGFAKNSPAIARNIWKARVGRGDESNLAGGSALRARHARERSATMQSSIPSGSPAVGRVRRWLRERSARRDS